MFGKEVELTVRLPKAGEPAVSPRLSSAAPTAPAAPEKEQPKPAPLKEETPPIEEESIEDDEKEVSLTSYNAHSEDYYMHSDTVNLALQVFDGKIIE